MEAWAYEYLTPIAGGYLTSKSARDCRTRKSQAIVHRIPAQVRITGGPVIGAKDDSAPTKNKRVRGRNRRRH